MLLDNIKNRNGVSVVSNHATHPGVLLKDEIEYRKLSKSKTALDLGLKPGHLSEIFAAKRNVSAQLALKLQDVLGIPAENWLFLQMKYDLVNARKQYKRKVRQAVFKSHHASNTVSAV